MKYLKLYEEFTLDKSEGKFKHPQVTLIRDEIALQDQDQKEEEQVKTYVPDYSAKEEDSNDKKLREDKIKNAIVPSGGKQAG